MYNFCTLFDSNYFSRGLTLYHSLENSCRNFHLYIFAFDAICYKKLIQLNLGKATIISLNEFEDEELLRVKNERTKAEYCWTCTSSTILYAIEKFNLENCTYIDADMYFYTDPKILFDEIKDASVALTEHYYPKRYDQSATSGKYCVQFVYFKNDAFGLEALRWWRNACVEWCYARLEDGKFGDQKYLDDWTERFENVYVLQNRGAGVALWNVQQYEIFKENDILKLREYKNNITTDLVFFHFHGLKIIKDQNAYKVKATKFELNSNVINLIYKDYIRRLLMIDESEDISDYDVDFERYSVFMKLYLPIHFKLRNVVLLQKIKSIFVHSMK